MTTLSLGFGPSDAAGDKASHRQIIFSHFRYYNVAVGKAREGLRHCPGIAIVMPRPEQEHFSVNGEPLVLPPGVALLLNGESFNVLSPSNDADTEYDDLSSLGVMEINASVDESFQLRDALELPSLLNSHDSGKMADVFHDLIYSDHATTRPSDANDFSLHLAAARIVGLLLDTTDHVPTGQIGGKGAAQLSRLRRYLLANLSHKITTSEMAEHLGLTQTHFCKRAKSLLGETPMSHLRRLRMERSLELLEHTVDSVDSIAYKVGYADRFSFSKEFKRHYGFSPVKYRKESVATLPDDAYLKATTLFEGGRHEQALSICEKALRKAGDAAGLDQIIHLQGRCLFVLGRSDEALAAWNRLEGGDYAWQARLQCCRLYFRNSQVDDALVALGQLWERAEGLKRNDVVQVWIEQVNALVAMRHPTPLRRYLNFRKDCFAADPQSKSSAIHACRCLGVPKAILHQCPDDEAVRRRALIGSGEYDQILGIYGSQLGQGDRARIYLETGNYDKVLALEPGVPSVSAAALVQLGRAEEAVERFPGECLDAYLKLGLYQEIVDHAPDPSVERIYALHALGRIDELKAYGGTGDWFWHFVRLYFDPGQLLRVDYPQSYLFVPLATLLLALQPGKSSEEMLREIHAIPRIDSNDFWAAGLASGSVLVSSILPALLGDPASTQRALDEILKNWRFFDRQRLYHDAAYLAGKIDYDAWRQQPYRCNVGERELFIQSLRHDLEGRSADACQGYQAYVDETTIYGGEKLFTHRFAEWRLCSLAPSVK